MSAAYSLDTYRRRHRARSGRFVDMVSAGSRILPRLVEALEADLLPASVCARRSVRATEWFGT